MFTFVSSTSFSILVNGLVKGYFPRKRGIRKGDPLSPFLFIILIEALGRSIKITSSVGLIEGIKSIDNSPSILILQFMEDTLTFSRFSIPQAIQIKHILDLYEEATSQKINFDKSKFFFIEYWEKDPT